MCVRVIISEHLLSITTLPLSPSTVLDGAEPIGLGIYGMVSIILYASKYT